MGGLGVRATLLFNKGCGYLENEGGVVGGAGQEGNGYLLLVIRDYEDKKIKNNGVLVRIIIL